VLTGVHSVVRRGMTDALARLIDLETARGHFHAGVDSPTLAFAIIRLTEGFVYSDVISDRVPDVDQATAVIEALLRGLDLARLPVSRKVGLPRRPGPARHRAGAPTPRRG
jgi:hypothetical protein